MERDSKKAKSKKEKVWMIVLTYFSICIKYLLFDSHESIRLIVRINDCLKTNKYATIKFDISQNPKHLSNPNACFSEAIKSTNAYLSGK